MTAMTMEFDGVRELSMEEIDAVAGGPAWFAVAAVIVLAGGAGVGAGYAAGRNRGYEANRDKAQAE